MASAELKDYVRREVEMLLPNDTQIVAGLVRRAPEETSASVMEGLYHALLEERLEQSRWLRAHPGKTLEDFRQARRSPAERKRNGE